MTATDPDLRRTIRRYAHEIYPHAALDEIRPLAAEVPYLYARAIGLEVVGTGWVDEDPAASTARTGLLVAARELAFLADALHQGLTGDEAWTWVAEHASDETGELVWDRAEHYGVDGYAIRPYLCGPEPSRHAHWTQIPGGSRIGRYVEGRESDCEACTEPVKEEQ